ncbi:hypothetical protein [Vibrio phage vB_VpaP_SJSY21]|nr:hypothetical protein [Vibrio phage vB_VpaP_SJSY21]
MNESSKKLRCCEGGQLCAGCFHDNCNGSVKGSCGGHR